MIEFGWFAEPSMNAVWKQCWKDDLFNSCSSKKPSVLSKFYLVDIWKWRLPKLCIHTFSLLYFQGFLVTFGNHRGILRYILLVWQSHFFVSTLLWLKLSQLNGSRMINEPLCDKSMLIADLVIHNPIMHSDYFYLNETYSEMSFSADNIEQLGMSILSEASHFYCHYSHDLKTLHRALIILLPQATHHN